MKQRLSQEDLNKCASFHWNLEEVTGDNIRTEGFKNTAKAKIDGILRVYRLAEKEFQPEYTTAQVFRDEENDMWKVEFRTDSGAGGQRVPGRQRHHEAGRHRHPGGAGKQTGLLRSRRLQEVLNEVQGRDHWRIHSHYDWRGRALNDWTDTTYWLRGLDWMHKSKLQDGDGYAVFGNMWVDGRYFDNDGYGWSENDEPYYQEKTPPEEVYRYPAPWLVSCNWDSYVIQLLSETEDDSGRSVRLHMIPKDGIQDLEEYDVTFFFDSEGSFQKAVIDTVEGFQAVTRETTTIDSLAWNRISAEIDGEYEYAVAINEETDPADWPDVDNCLAVVKGIQDRDHWRIRTYYNNDPWSETTLWLRGADWMEQTRLPGTGQGLVYSEMHQNGRFFKSGPRVWSDNFVPSWKEAAFPGEQEHFANVPWLISCDWELYDIAPAYRTQDAAGFSVRLKMTSRDRETAPDDYDVTFHFDLEGNFVKADLLVLDGQTQVSHQIIYIESTDRDEISAQMDKEYQRATK